MGVAIVGSGLAGLAAAAVIRTESPDIPVTVLEKAVPASNTALAGQRLLSRGAPNESLQDMVVRRYGDSPAAREFAALAVQEIERWQEIMTTGCLPGHGLTDLPRLAVTDRPEWFGPQLGSPEKGRAGRAREVLSWFRSLAVRLGVTFLKADAKKLIFRAGRAEDLEVVSSADEDNGRGLTLRDGCFVLAGGNPGGALFRSTNVRNRSTVALAYEAGLPIAGGTAHLLHPFGATPHDPNAIRGFHDTGDLRGVRVSFPDGGIDHETMALLERGVAAYHLPEIVKRFYEHGSRALLAFPDGHTEFCEVTHHYSHLGVSTTDGISVQGADRLFAAGDCAALLWTGHLERPSGAGLTRCLVDAAKVSAAVKMLPADELRRPPQVIESELASAPGDQPWSSALVDLNTAHLPRAFLHGLEDTGIGAAWQKEIKELPHGDRADTLAELSFGMALSYERAAALGTPAVFDKRWVREAMR